MALLTLTLVSEAVMLVDSASTVMTPDGPKTAGDLAAGDFVCLFSDGHMAVEIDTVESA